MPSGAADHGKDTSHGGPARTAEPSDLELFWGVYGPHHAAVSREVRAAAARRPRFAAVLEQLGSDGQAERDRENFERLSRAVATGDWEPYLEQLRRQGAAYAAMGLSFSAWYEVLELFREAVRPRLLEAYGDDVERLLRAVRGKNEFLDRAMSAIGEAYFAASSEIIRRQEVELQSAAARAHADRRFRSLIESAPDGFVITGPDGRIVLVNDQTVRLFGWSKEELVGQPVEVLIPDRYRQSHVRDREGYERDPRVRAMGEGRALYALRKDGSEFPVEISLSPAGDPDDPLVVSAVRDISSRRAAELELRRSRAQLLRAQQVAQLGSWEWDVESGAVNWSDELYRIFGVRRETFRPSLDGFLSRVHPADRESLRHTLERTLETHEPISHVERILRPDGEIRHLRTWGEVVLDEDDMARSLVGICQDVTDLIRTQEELRAARDELERRVRERTTELERSNADLEQFAYVASHDLREPLRMVASFLGLLERRYRGKLDPEADRWIEFAVDGAKRMQQLIADLLAYSRAGRSEEPLARVSLGAAVDAAVKNLDVAIGEAGAEVTRDPLPEVYGNSIQLTQLVQNLISNSLKFRGESPVRVHVSAACDAEMCTVSVRDNGMGLDVRHAGRIFQLFQRLQARDDYPGSGIGLAVAKKIVDRHGGRIWVESRPGEGATFRFTLHLPEGGERGD